MTVENDDTSWLNEDTPAWIPPWEKAAEPTPEPSTELVAPGITAVLPADLEERRRTFIQCWELLEDKQKRYLNAWRECDFNDRRTQRVIGCGKSTVYNWRGIKAFETARNIMREASAAEVLDPSKLLLRQEDAIEILLTPKPILHQGSNTGYFEVNAGAAARANETLMRAAGLLKDKEAEINIGIVGPALVIQVLKPDGTMDAPIEGVDVSLPAIEGQIVDDDSWLDV